MDVLGEPVSDKEKYKLLPPLSASSNPSGTDLLLYPIILRDDLGKSVRNVNCLLLFRQLVMPRETRKKYLKIFILFL